jgi:hypothetical protein
MVESIRHGRALLLFAIALTGCDHAVDQMGSVLQRFGDSPTTFEQAGPIRMATSERSVIFKSPTESNNCVLDGGSVTLTAARTRPLQTPLRIAYTHVPATVRNDVFGIDAGADGLAINGSGHYRFQPAASGSPWRSLRALSSRGVEYRAGERLALSIRPAGDGLYLITVGAKPGENVFRGTVLPTNGVVYVRDAIVSNGASSFTGSSEHDCGNWNSATEAAAALGRVQAHWPPNSVHAQ